MSARKNLFWNIYFKSYYLSLIINSLRNIFHIDKRKKNVDKLSPVYAVHGSAIIFLSHFFKAGGKIDKNFKLYCEEFSNAEIASKIGCKIFL